MNFHTDSLSRAFATGRIRTCDSRYPFGLSGRPRLLGDGGVSPTFRQSARRVNVLRFVPLPVCRLFRLSTEAHVLPRVQGIQATNEGFPTIRRDELR
jgi:hypothetical protein